MDNGDHIALKALSAGTSGKRTQLFRHFIYVAEQAQGDALATRLKRDGFEVETRMGADGTNWLVLARHKLLPDEEAIDRLREQLTEIADAAGGEYDGWDADVGAS